MTDPVEPLVVDLVEWVAKQPRRCADVLEAWRTSCPRLPVWEEAVERGFVTQTLVPGEGAIVTVSSSGLALLRAKGRLPAAAQRPS